MKQKHYHISLYIIIPVIFGGFSIFSAVMGFRVTEYCARHAMDPGTPVFWLTLLLGTLTYACGWLIVWIILKPVERFIEEAKRFSVLSSGVMKEKPSADKLEQFSYVFNQVTDVLTMVEARRLFPDIIAESKSMRGVLSQIMKVAPTDSTVLILGESGTGKELVANAIYKHSRRGDKPFVTFNCTAVPDGLWESELFGYEKGAFTGADARKPGKFEIADGGTFFLDEIGDIPLKMQAKLLRVLQEGEFEHLGGLKSIKIDIRFIAATNKDITKMVKEGTFREDLYHRLNVFSVRLPSLRERKEDIPVLLEHFLQKNAPRPGQISAAASQLLMRYSWPGNVRELENAVERATVMSEGESVEPAHLPADVIQGISEEAVAPLKDDSLSINEKLEEIEKNLIIDALHKAGGFQVRAAKLLGINPRQLSHRIGKYSIDPKMFKEGS